MKDFLIKQRLEKPIVIGDAGYIKIPYKRTVRDKIKKGRKYEFVERIEDKVFSTSCKVISVEDASVVVQDNSCTSWPIELMDIRSIGSKHYSISKEHFVHSTWDVGADPFSEHSWWANTVFYARQIEGLLYYLGVDRREYNIRMDSVLNVPVSEVNWNPFVVGEGGERVFYQRGFVWSLEDKQLLIESIYNNIEIGKFVFRRRGWTWMEQQVKDGYRELGFYDIVDGKQRANAILEFVQNKYPDKHGNYWGDLSDCAQYKFKNFGALTIGEMGEHATDADVLRTFLGINFTGVSMSQEHIDYVKSIKI